MDLKFQSSFIPKQPLVPQSRVKSTQFGLFSIIATGVFIVAIGMVGAVLIAQRVLNKSLEVLDAKIVEAENSFELATIEDLQITERRIHVASMLIDDHISFSEFLELLSQSTFQEVNYEALSYFVSDVGVIVIDIVGYAKNLNALSLQADLIRNIPGVSNLEFFEFSLGDEGGGVGFSMKFNLAWDVILYKNYLLN